MWFPYIERIAPDSFAEALHAQETGGASSSTRPVIIGAQEFANMYSLFKERDDRSPTS